MFLLDEGRIRCATEDLFTRFSQVNYGPPDLEQGRVLRADVLLVKPQEKFGREITRFTEVRKHFGPTAIATEVDILATIKRGDLDKNIWNYFLLPDCFVWVHWAGGHPIGRWFLLAHPDDTEYGAPPKSLVFYPKLAA